jgi:glycosyltransferase involved in cell wall biosynthesis
MNQPSDDKPAILYFGNDWFAENRTSSHHIARGLAARFRVYYVETGGLRAPKATGRDVKRIFAKVAKFFQGARPVEEGLNLRVRTLLLVPLQRFALVRWFNRILILWTLRWMLWREGVRRPVVWLVQPHLPFLLGRLNEQASVYYCIDDYAAFPHVNEDAIRALDDETTRKADIVFVASATLLDGKRRLNANTHLSPHGVDVEHFGRAQWGQLPVPAEIAQLPRPIIGFFGLIEQWIDLDLVDFLAAARPQWTFVMIGRVAVPDEQIPRRPNIRFLGKQPYENLPAFGKQFDAAIIPYRLTQQVINANPLKLREYLAMGKPVVAVSTPEIDKFADVVAVAKTREEFLERLDAALAAPPKPEEIRRRMERVADSSWDARLTEVLSIVNPYLEKPAEQAADLAVETASS